MKIYITAVLLFATAITGCHIVKETVEEAMEESLSYSDKENLRRVEKQMLQGDSVEMQIDRKISVAVKHIVATLKPEYRNRWLRKHRLGFLEISDIDRKSVTRMHKYVTEKTLTFSFLQPLISENFSIVERFLLKDVLKDLQFESSGSPDRKNIEQKLVERLGRSYGVDVLETGVVTESRNFLDINLRMIETKKGRIIAVGSVKIEKTEPVRNWLQEMGAEGLDRPDKDSP
ncbi:MAG TPA: hypothetical protein ENK58_08855 [Desulfobacterales bacterium]|nr:hypothetical protein [Desulfobacterales bacterium]